MRITLRITQAIVAAFLTLGFASAAFAEERMPSNGGFGWTYRSIQEVNASGVRGQAALKDNGDGSTTIVLELQGPCDGRSLTAAIHDGTPAKYSPEAAWDLAVVVNCTSTSVLPTSLKELQSTERVIVVQDPSGIIALGQIQSI